MTDDRTCFAWKCAQTLKRTEVELEEILRSAISEAHDYNGESESDSKEAYFARLWPIVSLLSKANGIDIDYYINFMLSEEGNIPDIEQRLDMCTRGSKWNPARLPPTCTPPAGENKLAEMVREILISKLTN